MTDEAAVKPAEKPEAPMPIPQLNFTISIVNPLAFAANMKEAARIVAGGQQPITPDEEAMVAQLNQFADVVLAAFEAALKNAQPKAAPAPLKIAGSEDEQKAGQ